MSDPRVQLRGIYATALTERLSGPFEVVAASAPIQRRFDADFETTEPDVTVVTTDDRLGVGVHGDPGAVGAVTDRLVDLGIDALAWSDPVPRGAVVEATVTETLGGGAVVDLGPREGYLQYDAADGRVEAGEERRLQVREPAAPWADRRPVVGEGLEAAGEVATLVRGADGATADVPDDERARELVRTTDLLDATVPDGWGLRWEPAAADAGVDALAAALDRAAERAERFEAHLDGADQPTAGAWVRFGRESRFALDDRRRRVVQTMPGHHRVKAGGEAASPAVDLLERLGVDVDDFPFPAVADAFGPAAGDRLRLHHGKPDGRQITLGRGEVTDRDGETVTLRREMSAGGTYDGLGVPREDGDAAITKLREGRWWYPTVYRDADGAVKGTYVNVCTPVEVFPDRATYVDLHVDVVRHADGAVERVDDDELDAAVAAGDVPEALAAKARDVAASVERALS